MKKKNSQKRTGTKTNGTARGGVRESGRQIRYAVVGLGYVAQNAVLPAFAHASKNSALAALVSDDDEKLQNLGKKYKVEGLYSYDRFLECVESERIDAVYIALPNSMHCRFSVEAAKRGVHVLCEKPLGTSIAQCQKMIEAADENGVKLMTAYRLHFDKTNMGVVKSIKDGEIGEPRIFSSVFSYQVREHNIRLDAQLGGGALFDIGIYCINAARYVFQDEPIAVYGHMLRGKDPRFSQVEETCSAILRFPKQRIAQFTCSFGAEEENFYEVLGTEGSICAYPAYDYAEPLSFEISSHGHTRTKKGSKHDQFAAEISYFSDCILNGESPEPSGHEGLADLRVIEALYQSAETGETISLEKFSRRKRASEKHVRTFPAIKKEPPLINAAPPIEH